MGWCVRMSDAIGPCLLFSGYRDGVPWMEKFAGVCGGGDSVGKFRNLKLPCGLGDPILFQVVCWVPNLDLAFYLN